MNEPFRDFYRTKLPHIQPLGGTFFVTFRLADSLPQSVRRVLQEEFEWQQKQLLMRPDYTPEQLDRLHRQFFGRYDALLDKIDNGPHYLKLDSVAQLVADALHFFDEKKYDLIAFTIMSNHVHVYLHSILFLQPSHLSPLTKSCIV
ncbi:hypothetical protein [Spirosoma linguale]|uniref:hypothetical protein n=1 Tax=Spirosoma linguale TaxID=108 RepID=UPI003CC7E9DF